MLLLNIDEDTMLGTTTFDPFSTSENLDKTKVGIGVKWMPQRRGQQAWSHKTGSSPTRVSTVMILFFYIKITFS
jgi:hypothetical protein